MPPTNRYSIYVNTAVIDLKQYLDTHPITHKNCKQLWEAHKGSGSTRSMIEKAFKDITGYRIKEYLVLVRLEYSKQYLRDGMNIKRIATKTWYKSQSAYCTAFKRCFNISPTDWVRNQETRRKK